MNGARAIWLDQHQRDDLTWIADYLHRHGFPDYGNALKTHVAAWDAAPADPVEAALSAIPEYASDVEVVHTSLYAIGWPGVAASPETDTPKEAP